MVWRRHVSVFLQSLGSVHPNCWRNLAALSPTVVRICLTIQSLIDSLESRHGKTEGEATAGATIRARLLLRASSVLAYDVKISWAVYIYILLDSPLPGSHLLFFKGRWSLKGQWPILQLF